MFSDQFLPTFPYLDIPLYNEIKSRNLQALYVLQEGDYRLIEPSLAVVYQSLDIKIIKKTTEILSLIDKEDILVTRFAYKGVAAKIASSVRSAKRKIIMLDPAAIDISVRECPAQYITAKSQYMKNEILKKFRHYADIFVTGTIHFDAAATTQVDKIEFMKSYGLDSHKKLALLTPANPAEANHQIGVDNEYAQIAKIVKDRCPDYELMIKAHPMDYTAKMPVCPGIIHKHEYYKGAYSWEKFAPHAVVVKADEGYKAFKACDVVLNVRSSIAMETPLFEKPLLNINRTKYVTNWPYSKDAMRDINMGELASVLNANAYFANSKGCKEYVTKYCFSGDGKSYVRIADVVVKILKEAR
ncbi:MAG: hypothetical protein WC523_00355 [Patescibacteria group bacterium]